MECFQFLIGTTYRLRVDYCHSRLTYFVHTHHSVKGLARFGYLRHNLVFTKIQFSVNNGMCEILHRRVGRDNVGFITLFFFGSDSFNAAFDFCNSRFELFRKRNTIIGNTGCHSAVIAVLSFHSLIPSHCAKHHIGIIHEILIARNTVCRFAHMNPIGNLDSHCFSFLQKENIRSNFRSCVLLKNSIRKSDSSQQVTAFSKVSSCLFVQLVHSELACDKCNYSTRLHLVHRLCGKVIVYLEIMLIVGFIADTVISERNITYNNIKTVVIERGLLKAFNLDTLLWIELLCDSARNAVQLHTVKTGIVTHIFRHF